MRFDSHVCIMHACILLWTGPNKYEDIAGLQLPTLTEELMDTWKRPDELVLNIPTIPMLRLRPSTQADAAVGKDAKGAAC